MDKESIFELQKIDCNCNDCLFMIRDFNKFNLYNKLNEGVPNAGRIHYGNCIKLNKEVSFITNTCQVETQNCFKHRKDK